MSPTEVGMLVHIVAIIHKQLFVLDGFKPKIS